MYKLTERQAPDGSFPLLVELPDYEWAMADAWCEADGMPDGYTVLVWHPDGTLAAKFVVSTDAVGGQVITETRF
jgi:hypothetical protein